MPMFGSKYAQMVCCVTPLSTVMGQFCPKYQMAPLLSQVSGYFLSISPSHCSASWLYFGLESMAVPLRAATVLGVSGNSPCWDVYLFLEVAPSVNRWTELDRLVQHFLISYRAGCILGAKLLWFSAHCRFEPCLHDFFRKKSFLGEVNRIVC